MNLWICDIIYLLYCYKRKKYVKSEFIQLFSFKYFLNYNLKFIICNSLPRRSYIYYIYYMFVIRLTLSSIILYINQNRAVLTLFISQTQQLSVQTHTHTITTYRQLSEHNNCGNSPQGCVICCCCCLCGYFLVVLLVRCVVCTKYIYI